MAHNLVRLRPIRNITTWILRRVSRAPSWTIPRVRLNLLLILRLPQNVSNRSSSSFLLLLNWYAPRIYRLTLQLRVIWDFPHIFFRLRLPPFYVLTFNFARRGCLLNLILWHHLLYQISLFWLNIVVDLRWSLDMIHVLINNLLAVSVGLNDIFWDVSNAF